MAKQLRIDLGKPNKLLDVSCTTLSPEPLLGVLMLESDQGTIPLAINRTMAAEIVDVIEEFLAGKERGY